MPIPQVGDKLPDFTLPMATAEARSKFVLSEALGKGDLLFAFYPLAFTSTCTMELCETRDSMHFFEHVGARPFGFSIDTPHANLAYAREQKLNFPLISDPNREVVDKIWETQRTSGVERCAKRGVMIVDAHGVVKYVWKTENASEWPGLADVRKVLHAGHAH